MFDAQRRFFAPPPAHFNLSEVRTKLAEQLALPSVRRRRVMNRVSVRLSQGQWLPGGVPSSCRRSSCTAFVQLACAALIFVVGSFTRAAETPPPRLNRLASEKSPYLREHATNPVDWYPWGEEAFARARREDKPIFLSIGYSTCHWCHVMEHESFENPEIAALLNANFVCIKVDREERPDLDRVYMMFVLASTGSAGWPMSVWLTPELKPFLGGTYFPPENRGGLPGLKVVAKRVAGMWRTDRETVLRKSSEMLREMAVEAARAQNVRELAAADLRQQGFSAANRSFDSEYGGFDGAPKFPGAMRLELLIDLAATSPQRGQREAATQMVLKTLRQITAGGIHDQIGGGFHRYAVDARWRLPHFEKMLYDQAQLANACLSAWQLTGEGTLRAAAEDTLNYVRDVLTDPAGGFHTAEDADSLVTSTGRKEEGAFYLWTAGDLEAALGPDDAMLMGEIFGVELQGNVATESRGELSGKNVLYRARSVEQVAKKHQLDPAEVEEMLADSRVKLRHFREQRPRPARDDKIVAAWNGLMISAFARAAQVLNEPSYATMAARAATFLRERMFDPTTATLSRSYRAGARDPRAFSEDYACVIQGLLDLYEANFDVAWLQWAIQLQEKQNELFLDTTNGGYFANTADDRSVVLRLKENDEGAEPAASSLAVKNLVRLSEMLQRDEWRQLARRTALAFVPHLRQTPLAMPQMLASIGWLEGSPQMILIQGDAGADSAARLVRAVQQRYLPRRVLVRIDQKSRAFFAERLELVRDLPPDKPGSAMAYVCENFVCQMPTSDPDTLARLLVGKR